MCIAYVNKGLRATGHAARLRWDCVTPQEAPCQTRELQLQAMLRISHSIVETLVKSSFTRFLKEQIRSY